MYLNCLLHVSGNRPIEVTEWLDYHLALGFDSVYVYDAGSRDWLPDVCSKYGDKVRLMPGIEGGWAKRRDVVSDHLAKRKSPEWCVCLTDNEFVWIDPRQANSIKKYVELAGMRTGSRAITGFYVYMGAKNAMPNRVGTYIDCFLHTRKNPQGRIDANDATLFGGETFFLYDRIGMQPLAGPIKPTCAEWVDANGARLTDAALSSVIASGFDPSRYAMRIYKYAVLSDKEMGYSAGQRPSGYTELDLSMQNARKQFLGIPVETSTEELFTKPYEFDEFANAVQNGVPGGANMFDTTISGIPITKAKIDQLILEGNYLEDVIDYLNARGLEYNHEALVTAFDAERKTIVESSPIYRQVQSLIDEGKSVREISAITNIAVNTLDRMAGALKVLDIRTGALTDDVIAEAVGAFEASDKVAMDAAQSAQNDATFAAIHEKRLADRRERDKVRREKKRADAGVKQAVAETDAPTDEQRGVLDEALDALGVCDDLPEMDKIAEIEKIHSAKPTEKISTKIKKAVRMAVKPSKNQTKKKKTV